MMGEVFKIYKKNFKNFIAFFIISIILALILNKFGGTFFQSSNLEDFYIKNLFNGKSFIKVVVFILIEIYVSAYGLVIARKITKEESVEQGKVFSYVFHFYPKFLGLNVVFIIIIILISLLVTSMMVSAISSYGGIIFLGLLFIVVLVILGIFTNSIMNYLIYSDDTIKPSIKEGIKIGKKYFFKILGILLIASLLSTLTTIDAYKNNMLILVIISFIVSMYTMYLNLYIMNLCKLENPID